ncbi:hypothetical protein ACQEVB_11665 [Pseudonocardia sp. CA-107938]|uniref:hypothetical protein n=1 Tax=Pseudonocardia sp. CA-107938 TaxID=3240021 RepID=UPI003D91DB81
MTAKHTARPLVVASETPIAELPTAHGLTAFLYPAASGICSCCHEVAAWLFRVDRRCEFCHALCDSDHNELGVTA